MSIELIYCGDENEKASISLFLKKTANVARLAFAFCMNPAMTKESPKYSGGVEKRDGIGGAFEGGLYSHRSPTR
jgi:hypothetical protein